MSRKRSTPTGTGRAQQSYTRISDDDGPQITHFRMAIIHADDLCSFYIEAPATKVVIAWLRWWKIYSALMLEIEDLSPIRMQEVIQARHYVMALTYVLRCLGEWDEVNCQPVFAKSGFIMPDGEDTDNFEPII